jgi:predicted pyridoxine 5'-phosphate oxidase superfamily flavin-nucleotide-binding protein
MSAVYHSGELAVQARAGVLDRAERAGRMIRSTIPQIAAEFMRLQRFAILGSTDSAEQVWASLLWGRQGFMRTIDERTVAITPQANEFDPLSGSFQKRDHAGIVVVDFSTRRRMRMNGQAVRSGDTLYFQTNQVYSNCPQFIRTRQLQSDVPRPQKRYFSYGTSLSVDQQHWISSCETFFIASFHPEGGADASHRGGEPGFVKAINEVSIMWPDYAGNSMLNTLGNLHAYPSAGLLFIDFAQGRTLQLTGEAHVIWSLDENESKLGKQRTVNFQTREVIETGDVCPLRWHTEPMEGSSKFDARSCLSVPLVSQLQ